MRTCPICRVPTHFVTPSKVWPTSEEQKKDIVDGYVARLAQVDCKVGSDA